MFIDTVEISLFAGKGGDGVIAWRREKFIPKGGPAGGDGGKGGSVLVMADPNTFSLEGYRNKKILKAQNGKNGGSNNQKGKDGEDLILLVPPGTLIKDKETQAILHDLVGIGEKITLCQGGLGGRGNSQFKSSTNQAPNFATRGRVGKNLEIELELKLLADVGLVGFPNAGKSTLLKQITKVDVKIAPYPFTTLKPNIALLEFDDYSRILIADIPGIIEKAHENKGLGLSFLKHIERTEALVFMIDLSGIDGRDPFDDFEILQNELKSYSEEMLKKPFLVALNKIDTKEGQENLKHFKKKFPFDPSLLFEISALTKEGLSPLVEAVRKLAQAKGKRYN